MDLTKKCARCGFALGHHSAGNESFCPEKVKGECRFSKNKFEPRGEKGVIPLKPLGVSVESGKRQNAGSPRNPESLTLREANEANWKKRVSGEIDIYEKKKEGLK